MTYPLITHAIDEIDTQESVKQLESGKVLFFPEYFYTYIDSCLMSDTILDTKHKNVSYDFKNNKLGGYNKGIINLESMLRPLMCGYAEFAHRLIQVVLPDYLPNLEWGRTSFRPAQISGRSISKRKDDTRLHVDAFPASPVNGMRILRVFCNVNPDGKPRVWNLGEPFSDVLDRFSPQIPDYSKMKAKFLHLVKATKSLRSAYDHYMLHLHDTMKRDDAYQQEVNKIQFDFPAQSTWIVFTDHVSHAALSGQFLLEQTFYLPVDKMAQPEMAPLNQLKKIKADIAKMRQAAV